MKKKAIVAKKDAITSEVRFSLMAKLRIRFIESSHELPFSKLIKNITPAATIVPTPIINRRKTKTRQRILNVISRGEEFFTELNNALETQNIISASSAIMRVPVITN